MKKILLILVCSYSFTSFSQDFNKGDKLIGGSLSFSFFDVNNSGPGYYTAGNVGILPSYSWFIKNNLAMGMRGNISYMRAKQVLATEERTNSSFITGISVFLKKYKPIKDKFGMYFENEIGGDYNVTKDKFISSSSSYTKSRMYGLSYHFNPGVYYRFSNRFMGEGNIGGVYASYYSGQSSNNFGLGASFLRYFNLGINYVIEKKRQG